jgi:hypothetical protein
MSATFHFAGSAGAVKLIMIDAARGVFFGGVAPSKDNYVIGW